MQVKAVWRNHSSPDTSATSPSDAPLQEQIVAAIRRVYDPEISVNVYDLGLIYAVQINSCGEVLVKMTLTSPGCPVAGILPAQVAAVIKALPGVSDACVELVWDPPWSQDLISDAAKLSLGLL